MAKQESLHRTQTPRLPHEHVYARLGVSDIDGVGVFAICAIPMGTDIFSNDLHGIRWVEEDAVAGIGDDAIGKFYEDFAIKRNGKLGCPENFNNLTVGWYLNAPLEGKTANITIESDNCFMASRDIAAGEELTIDYADFAKAGI